MLIEITYNVTDVYMSTTETPVYVEISFEQPSGSAAVWGSITGTLSNQTDLQNALNAKLDESTIDGGTEGQILSKASATDFDFAWINNYAKYLATNVRNQTGSTINAFQVVYISGATGNKPLISLADADTEATSSKTYGVTATSIANNGTGDVVTAGELSGINTSVFNEGDLLWLSTTAGGVVTTPPAEPAHSVFIGYVVRSHPTLGVIDVAIANGYELNELHGVQITTPTDNQGLFYNATSTLWENKSITTALGYTPVPTTRNITINGVTYDLSADRTWTISAGISGSGASGQVTYWTGASAVSGSNNLFWDAANGRLGIGTNVPAYPLHLLGSRFYQSGTTTTAATTLYNIVDNTSVNNSYVLFGVDINGGTVGFGSQAGAYMSVGKNGTGTARPLILHNYDAQPIIFATNNSERARIFGNGNFAINSSIDFGVRFAVSGDTILRGSGATSATTALTVQNSSSTNLFRVSNAGEVNISTIAASSGINILNLSNSVSTVFRLRDDGVLLIGSASASAAPIIYAFEGTVGNRSLRVGIQSAGSLTPVPAFNINQESNFTYTTGTGEFTTITANFLPTSGTGTLAYLSLKGTINQTGGANGITRGLYVNPTLTAAADWRSIEWSNNSGWGLYGAGTAPNYLAGNLGIGVLGLAETTFFLNKNITGGTTAWAMRSQGTIQSDVTSGRYFVTLASTQAAAFTVSTIFHYLASATTFGAGSTVTEQYGFHAASQLTGATNNYGFYGNIAAGTGRWNLYMAGTADNYLAGDLGIGTTSVTNWLNIAASTTAKAHINLVAGSTPTAPANGDIWFDGTDIKMRIGGVTKTFTLV